MILHFLTLFALWLLLSRYFICFILVFNFVVIHSPDVLQAIVVVTHKLTSLHFFSFVLMSLLQKCLSHCTSAPNATLISILDVVVSCRRTVMASLSEESDLI